MSTTIRADEVEDGDVISIDGESLTFSKTDDYRFSYTNEEVMYISKPDEKHAYPYDETMTIGIEDGYFYLPPDYPVTLIDKREV